MTDKKLLSNVCKSCKKELNLDYRIYKLKKLKKWNIVNTFKVISEWEKDLTHHEHVCKPFHYYGPQHRIGDGCCGGHRKGDMIGQERIN